MKAARIRNQAEGTRKKAETEAREEATARRGSLPIIHHVPVTFYDGWVTAYVKCRFSHRFVGPFFDCRITNMPLETIASKKLTRHGSSGR